MAVSSIRISAVSADGALLPRQPELGQAAQSALIGVHPEEGENGLVIQGRLRPKSKPGISEKGGHRQAGGGGARFDLCALPLGDDYLERPFPIAALLHLAGRHGLTFLLSGARQRSRRAKGE